MDFNKYLMTIFNANALKIGQFHILMYRLSKEVRIRKINYGLMQILGKKRNRKFGIIMLCSDRPSLTQNFLTQKYLNAPIFKRKNDPNGAAMWWYGTCVLNTPTL